MLDPKASLESICLKLALRKIVPARTSFPEDNGGGAVDLNLMSLNEQRSRSSVSLRVANRTRSPFA
jgi:hypothetical protein